MAHVARASAVVLLLTGVVAMHVLTVDHAVQSIRQAVASASAELPHGPMTGTVHEDAAEVHRSERAGHDGAIAGSGSTVLEASPVISVGTSVSAAPGCDQSCAEGGHLGTVCLAVLTIGLALVLGAARLRGVLGDVTRRLRSLDSGAYEALVQPRLSLAALCISRT